MTKRWYFVRQLDDLCSRPDPRAKYQVQLLDRHGRGIEWVYLDDRGEIVGPAPFTVSAPVAEAALRQEFGRGDYVDEAGHTMKPF